MYFDVWGTAPQMTLKGQLEGHAAVRQHHEVVIVTVRLIRTVGHMGIHNHGMLNQGHNKKSP